MLGLLIGFIAAVKGILFPAVTQGEEDEEPVKQGTYFITYSGWDFENYVLDKLLQIIPENFIRPKLLKRSVRNAIRELEIRSIIPEFKTTDRAVERRTSLLDPRLLAGEFNPAFLRNLSSLKEGSETDDSGPPGAHGILNMRNKHAETLVDDHQHEFLDLLNIKYGNGKSDDPDELAGEIDRLTISVLREYDALSASTSNTTSEDTAEDMEEDKEKIDLCYKVFVKRLQCQANLPYDLMTEDGWKGWKGQAVLAGSFAVLYVALQMRRKKKLGVYHNP